MTGVNPNPTLPSAGQTFMILHESTLGQKASAYAFSGIPTYWIVNLNARRVEVFTDPVCSARHYSRQKRPMRDLPSLTTKRSPSLTFGPALEPNVLLVSFPSVFSHHRRAC